MKLTLGFSPCPNDTFIFDALVHHKIDTEGLEFEVIFAVEASKLDLQGANIDGGSCVFSSSSISSKTMVVKPLYNEFYSTKF